MIPSRHVATSLRPSPQPRRALAGPGRLALP